MEAVVKQVHQYLLSWLFVLALHGSWIGRISCKSTMITLHQSINIALKISADSVDK